MNQKIRSLVLIALATSLPLALNAQSTSGSGSGSTTGSSTSGSTGATNSGSMNSDSTRSSTTPSTSGAELGSTGSLSRTAGIQRVSQDSLDRQLTAKALIGKNVHDNQGQRIGEVKDVVLDASAAGPIASAFSARQSAGGASQSSDATQPGSMSGTTAGAGSGSAGSTGSSGYASTPSTTESGDRASRTGTAGSTDRSLADTVRAGVGSAMSAFANAGPAAVISSGGFLGMGNDLVRVPLSQLNYDADSDRITLNVSQSEIASLTQASDTTRGAAE